MQVLGDLLAATIAIHFSGGATSEFWPFLTLTVMASALFFARRGFVALYATVAALMCWLVCVLDGGGWLPPSALKLASLLSMVALICAFYGERMAESRALAKTKDEILSRVTHELRTPLSALRGFVYLAQKREAAEAASASAARGDETPSTKLGQTLQRIDVQVDRLARMVSDLYDASAVQAGKLKLEPSVCDLIAIVREVALRFRTVHPHLDLRWSGPETMWGQWDAARIDQLLSNLVGNAVKYAGEASMVEVIITPASGGSAHLQVHDDGPGIPADKLALIFEPFQRIDDSGNQRASASASPSPARSPCSTAAPSGSTPKSAAAPPSTSASPKAPAPRHRRNPRRRSFLGPSTYNERNGHDADRR